MLSDEAREWLKHGKEVDADYANQVDAYIEELESECKIIRDANKTMSDLFMKQKKETKKYREALENIARDTSNNQDFYLQHLAREALGQTNE